MELLRLAPGEVLRNPLVDCEVTSVEFARWLDEPGSTPASLKGYRMELGEVRHCLIHNVADNGRWSNRPGNPNVGNIDDMEGYNVGWDAPDRGDEGHGHFLYCQHLATAPRCTVRRSAFIAGFSTAAKFYAEDGTTCKVANMDITDNFFVGWTLFGGKGLGAQDLLIERNVFFGNVSLGYVSRSRRIIFRDNVIFGNLQLGKHDDLVMENNVIVTRPPYRPVGWLYGPGNFGLELGSPDAAKGETWQNWHVRPTVAGNVIYSDSPENMVNNRTPEQASAAGAPVGDTSVHPLAAFGAFERRVEIPERNATRVFRFDMGGVVVPADAGRVLYPPPNPIGWEGPAPAIDPLDSCLGIWREMDEKDVRIEQLERALALERFARVDAEAARVAAEAGQWEADNALADEIHFADMMMAFMRALEAYAVEEDAGPVSEATDAALVAAGQAVLPLIAQRWRGREGYTPRRMQEMENEIQALNTAVQALVTKFNDKETERAAAVANSDRLVGVLGSIQTLIADALNPQAQG